MKHCCFFAGLSCRLGSLSRHELPTRCFPKMQDIAYALSSLALHWQWFDMCIEILVGFDCLLCTGELLQLKGITDSVSVTNAALIRLLARFIQTKQPGDSIIERLPQAFRRSFRQLVDGLSLNNLLMKPYSMRRGGATSLFRATNSLDVVVLKGRWANQRTERIYVNTSLQDIAAHSITPLLFFFSILSSELEA